MVLRIRPPQDQSGGFAIKLLCDWFKGQSCKNSQAVGEVRLLIKQQTGPSENEKNEEKKGNKQTKTPKALKRCNWNNNFTKPTEIRGRDNCGSY